MKEYVWVVGTWAPGKYWADPAELLARRGDTVLVQLNMNKGAVAHKFDWHSNTFIQSVHKTLEEAEEAFKNFVAE